MPAVKNVGEPCAGEPHARFDGGREETSDSRPCRATLGASRLPDQPPTTGRREGAMGSGQVAAARSSVLVGGDRTGMSWIDPHKRTLTVLVIERRGARRRALQDLRRRAPGSGGVGTVVGAIARW